MDYDLWWGYLAFNMGLPGLYLRFCFYCSSWLGVLGLAQWSVGLLWSYTVIKVRNHRNQNKITQKCNLLAYFVLCLNSDIFELNFPLAYEGFDYVIHISQLSLKFSEAVRSIKTAIFDLHVVGVIVFSDFRGKLRMLKKWKFFLKEIMFL